MSRFLDRKLAGLTPYVPGEQPKGIEDLIKLNTNESPFPPSPKAVAAVTEEAVKDLRLYPDPECTGLTAAIAEDLNVSADQVATGNGSDELLAFCFHGLCPNGAAFPDITYGFYPVFCEMFGAKSTVIPLKEDLSVDPKDYAGLKETVFLANPNAPTGIFLPLDGVRELLNQDPDRLVVVDEAYVDFGAESAASLLGEYENLLVVRTFSKSRQLAGARLAFAVGSSELVSDIKTMKFSFNPYSANRIALIAGEQAMRDTEYFDRCRAEIMENREYTADSLRKLGFHVPESRTNFVFAGNPELGGRRYYEALRDRGILVRYFDKDRIRDYVRITIGTKKQMETLVRATEEIIGIGG